MLLQKGAKEYKNQLSLKSLQFFSVVLIFFKFIDTDGEAKVQQSKRDEALLDSH